MRIETVFPISKTKIIPPRRRENILTRPRLIEDIHSLLGKKLVFINAPAGYGKTSLLIDMIDKSEIPICWLALDVMDQEPQRFLSYFIACIQEKFPDFGSESTNVLMNAVSLEKENEKLVITLTNEIYQSIHEHFAIVLDDHQFVAGVPAITVFLNRFIQLAGEHCHLLLASRLVPSFPDLHLMVARDLVGGLGIEKLAFTAVEIQTLFAQNNSQSLSQTQAEEIIGKTDGWITSIALTGLTLSADGLRQNSPAARTGIELYEYFTREVLANLSGDLREFLLLTSLFDDVSLQLCITVLEPLVVVRQLDWKVLFQIVQENNLFALPVGGDTQAFRYHHLFQEFLQTKLQEENPAIIRSVMVRLAAWYKQSQDWEKAHHIYENIDAQDDLVALIEEAGSHFIMNGRIVTLGGWLEHLSDSLIQQNPRLLSLQGAVAYTRGDTQLGVSLLSQAEEAFRARDDVENLALALVRRASAYRELGDLTCALADADETITLTSALDNPEAQRTCAMAQRVRGMTLFRLGRAREAATMLEKSLALVEKLGIVNQIPIHEMELGAVCYTLGRVGAAIRHYQSALKTWKAAGNLGWQATLLNNLAVLHHYRGEYQKAFQMLEEAIQCAQKSGYLRAQALALSSLGDLLVDLQELGRAEECYDQTLIIASQLSYAYLIYYASVAKARAARLTGRLGAAEALLRDLYLKLQNSPSPGEEALFRAESGRVLLYNNKPQAAVDELTQALTLYEQDGRVLETSLTQLWLSAALLASGQTSQAAGLAAQILPAYKNQKEPAPLLAAAQEVERWLETVGLANAAFPPLKTLFESAAALQNELPGIRRSIRQHSTSAFIPPPHINIQSFGSAQVYINHKRVSTADWQTRETRDLFFFFLNSKPATKEEIAAVFWPDISIERLKMRFKTSIYRLRHAVGQYTILFSNERYCFNHNIDYEYDLETYNSFVKKARASADPLEELALLQSAADLAQGGYLADIDSEWADTERRQFEMEHVAALLQLARLYLQTSQPALALKVCQGILKSDHVAEEAYRLQMKAHTGMGNRTAAAEAYKKCVRALQSELGISPDEETEKLYRQII